MQALCIKLLAIDLVTLINPSNNVAVILCPHALTLLGAGASILSWYCL